MSVFKPASSPIWQAPGAIAANPLMVMSPSPDYVPPGGGAGGSAAGGGFGSGTGPSVTYNANPKTAISPGGIGSTLLTAPDEARAGGRKSLLGE